MSSLLEALAVDLVDLVELQARLGLERGERPDRLRRQRPAVDQEQDAPRDAGLHQPVDLVDHREGLAGAGGHGDEHLALAVADGLLDGGVGLDLVRPQAQVLRDRRESLRSRRRSRGSSISSSAVGRVEAGDPARPVQLVADVVEPDHLAVGRVQERDAELALVHRHLVRCPCE